MNTPECDKLSAVAERSQEIGAFLDWLLNERSIPVELCIYEDDSSCMPSSYLKPCCISIEKLLAEYFKINLNKVEKERVAILDEIRRSIKECAGE